jgi:thymidylate synthase
MSTNFVDNQLVDTPSLEFDSLDDIQRWALKTVLEVGSVIAPRGLQTRECIAAHFVLRNPRRRCVLASARRWSLPLAIGEFCWHLSGSDSLSHLEYYAPRWRQFSDDKVAIRGSCYGKRVFSAPSGKLNQWQQLVSLLQIDPDTRRAVLILGEPMSARHTETVDVACASTLQFLVRNDEVHAVLNIRSNDIILGLPYDVFLFTMLQELLACQLGLRVGKYYHFAGSLHLYERDAPMARRIAFGPTPQEFEMPAMQAPEELPNFLALERAIRTNEATTSEDSLSSYWSELAKVLFAFRVRRIPSHGQQEPSIYQPVLDVRLQ